MKPPNGPPSGVRVFSLAKRVQEAARLLVNERPRLLDPAELPNLELSDTVGKSCSHRGK